MFQKINSHVSLKLLTLFFLVVIFASVFFHMQKSEMAREAYLAAHQIYPQEYYKNAPISAKSAYVFDYTDQKPLFELHEDSPRPLASLAKLVSIPLALDLLGENTTVVIPENIDLQSESDYDLKIGSKWNTLSLAGFSLIGSSNAGVEALQYAADNLLKSTGSTLDFIGMMNARVKEEGLLHTSFLNSSGLDISPTEPGAMGTAHDMMTLIDILFPKYKPLLEETAEPSATFYDAEEVSYLVANTNTALGALAPVIFSKTGYTDLAGGNLLIVYQSRNRTIGICILGSTSADRFTDMIALKNATETYLDVLSN